MYPSIPNKSIIHYPHSDIRVFLTSWHQGCQFDKYGGSCNSVVLSALNQFALPSLMCLYNSELCCGTGAHTLHYSDARVLTMFSCLGYSCRCLTLVLVFGQFSKRLYKAIVEMFDNQTQCAWTFVCECPCLCMLLYLCVPVRVCHCE